MEAYVADVNYVNIYNDGNILLVNIVLQKCIVFTICSDERKHVLQTRAEAVRFGYAPARESVWQYFVDKCANNLHIVLAMSPIGDTLRTRCRNFPGTFPDDLLQD